MTLSVKFCKVTKRQRGQECWFTVAPLEGNVLDFVAREPSPLALAPGQGFSLSTSSVPRGAQAPHCTQGHMAPRVRVGTP